MTSQKKVYKILVPRGIDCYFEGSVVHGLFVKHSDAQRTIQILKNAPELTDNWIKFSERFIPISEAAPGAKTKSE